MFSNYPSEGVEKRTQRKQVEKTIKIRANINETEKKETCNKEAQKGLELLL